MTARWVVDAVRPHREIDITWQPISLLEKNKPPVDSEYYGPVLTSHRYLRVMEALRAAAGDEAVEPFYWAAATLIHNDGVLEFDVARLLKQLGFDPGLAAAAEDEAWDAEIRERMDRGLALTGDDVGTPLIAFDDSEGNRVGLFGPVITRVPTTSDSLKLWDGFVAMATVPGFWELKRTRTEAPDFGERPSSVPNP